MCGRQTPRLTEADHFLESPIVFATTPKIRRRRGLLNYHNVMLGAEHANYSRAQSYTTIWGYYLFPVALN